MARNRRLKNPFARVSVENMGYAPGSDAEWFENLFNRLSHSKMGYGSLLLASYSPPGACDICPANDYSRVKE